jgi:Uma2 family endonuclease
MVGARWEHERIAGNIYIALQTSFRKKASTCRAFKETFYLKRKTLDLSVFPDVIVRCGTIDRGEVSVDDATALFEVLSPGTEPRDRYEKWESYKALPSLRHYVLITRDKPLVEIRTKSGLDWTGLVVEGLDKTLSLPGIDFEMPVAAIYEDVLTV